MDLPEELLDERDGLLDLATERPRLLVRLRVLGQRALQIVGKGGVPDEQAGVLISEGAVDPCEGLHEQRALERPVQVERVHRRRVVAGEHHVLDDDDLQLVVDVPEPLLDHGVLRVTPHVLPYDARVGRVAGVDDLDPTLIQLVGVPLRAAGDDRRVQPGADLARAADEQRLPGRRDQWLHRLPPGVPVREQVVDQHGDPLRVAVHGVDDRDALLDLRALDVVETDRGVVGGAVEVLLADLVAQRHLDQPRREVHRHCRPVLDGAGEVVDVDIVAEHLARVPVGERDRGAGEGDQCGVRKSVLEMPRVAVEVVVVAAVRLVDDHDDVAPVGQQRVVAAGVALVLRPAELLQGGEVDAAGGPGRQLLPQLGAPPDLPRFLGQQPADGEPLVELPVELGPVGDHDDGGVGQLRRPRDPVGVELHLHRLAGALCVPDDAGLAVAAHGLDGAGERLRDGEVLVRLGDPLVEPARALVERGEPAQELQEPLLVVDTVQRELQPGHRLAVQARRAGCDDLAVVIDVPRREVVQKCERRPVLREQPVGDQSEHGEPERHRELVQVRLDLRVGGGDVCRHPAGLLQLDDAHGHSVAEEHQVEAPVVLGAADGDLAGHQPVVAAGIGADQPDRRRGFLAVVVDIRDAAVALNEPVVDSLVLRDRVVRSRLDDVGERLLQVDTRDIRVEPA